MEAVTDFIFLGFKIIADGDYSHEIRRWLLLGKKDMTNLDSVLKSTLLTKVHTVKAMVFPVVTYSCGSWTKKKAECQRIDAFELWCWRRLLRVPWAVRSNQSILKKINPEYSLDEYWTDAQAEAPIFCHLMMRTADSSGKPLMLGNIESRRRGHQKWDGWMASLM